MFVVFNVSQTIVVEAIGKRFADEKMEENAYSKKKKFFYSEKPKIR
jgi:hypothetical protein